MVKTVFQGVKLNGVEHLAGKGEFKQHLRLGAAYSALLHVKERLFVQLSYCGAMTALHVVSIDFQHGLGKHAGLFCTAQIGVTLVGYGLLGVLSYQYAAGKCSCCLVVKHIFIQFVACTVRHAVIYQCIVVHMLCFVGYYTTIHVDFRSASESYDEFIDAVFNREAPMPAEEQKTTFGTILGDALNDACSLDVVQTVHSRLCGMIEEHKASKDPEPLTITGRTMKTMLTACGVPGEKAEKFEEACAEQFGADAALSPRNLVETKKFEIKTPEVQIRVDPEYSEWIETRYIDGAPYILSPAGAGVQVNGVPIAITRPDVEYEEEE